MNPTERIVKALRDHGHEPHRTGTGWICLCPAHDDQTPSLSISTGDDGRVLMHCHARCTFEKVCEAIGLRPRDLFSNEPGRRYRHSPKTRRRGDGDKTHRKVARDGGSVTVANDGNGGRTFPTADDAVAELEKRLGKPSAIWTYHNAAGEPIALIVRFETPKGKEFRPVSRLADGSGWVIRKFAGAHPLYGLPDLFATQPGDRVYVTEGEKAADAARAIGLTATTSAGGADRAKGSDWSPLAGHDVVILLDHDIAGERYAKDVVRLARAAGAKSVRVVRLVELWAEMPKGGDMADLLEHRGGDVEAIRAEVEALTDKTEVETALLPALAVPAFKPFPVDVLPEPIRSFVADASKAIGCDASFVAMPLLAGLASAIGNTHRIALKRGWSEPAILWMALVGESGTQKSPGMEVALRPIRKRQHDALKRHAEAMKDYAEAHAIYERDAAQWKRSKSNTPPPAAAEAPIADRCWTDDATTEALAVLLQQNPRGLLMVRDELAGWFNFDRYAGGKGGGDVAKWLEMFGGRPMLVDRKGGGVIYVPHAAVWIAGGIQPETLRRALGREHRDNGLAARLLFAMPPRKAKRWSEADVDETTEAALAVVFDRLFELIPETDDDGDERPRLVHLTDEGKRAWVTFYNEHAREQVDFSGDEAAAWSKLEGYAARLALVIHFVRWAADDASLRDPARVDEASVAAGVRLARWFGDEAQRVYAILSESDEDRNIRQLVDWMISRGGCVTVRDLMRGPREYRDAERAREALDAVVAAGHAVWEVAHSGLNGGRPTDHCRLVTGLPNTRDGDETPLHSENRAGSVALTTSG